MRGVFLKLQMASLLRDSPSEGFFRLKFNNDREENMYLRYQKFALLGVALGLILTTLNQVNATEPKAAPSPREIPGITADDMFPSGCVNCHLNFTDRNMDTRISTSLAKWTEKVEPKLLEKAQAASSQGVVLVGKHPSATESLTDIPMACIECHSSMSQKAPSFGQMIHLIHLSGGQDNHYMTLFQGECTHCHKLNLNTGKWFIPSDSEK